MAKAKIVTTFEFEYDEALFEKWFFEAGEWCSAEHYEQVMGEKIPTCEEYLAKCTNEDIIFILNDIDYYGYSEFITDFEYKDSEFEKI